MSAEVGQLSTDRPPIRVWVVAAIEIAAAVAVARLMLSSSTAAGGTHHAGMTHGSSPPRTDWSWTGIESVYAAAVLITALWFSASRHRTAAVATATAMTALICSGAARAAAGGSHLVAMLVLETAMTAVPLLLVFAVDGRQRRLPAAFGRSRMFLVAGAAGYGALIAAIHLPAVHGHVIGDGGFPTWLIAVAVAIGVVFWHGVLHGRQSVRTRRRGLIGAQEVAAFVGLLSLFGDGDQRIGGIAMLGACALSTGLVLRRIRDDPGLVQR